MQRDSETAVRDAYAALIEGGVADLLPLLALHVEVHLPDSLPFGGIYQGHEQVAHLARLLREHFADLTPEPDRFVVQDEHVAVVGRLLGRSVQGVDFDVTMAGLWRVEDGLIERYQELGDTAALLEAIERPQVAAG